MSKLHFYIKSNFFNFLGGSKIFFWLEIDFSIKKTRKDRKPSGKIIKLGSADGAKPLVYIQLVIFGQIYLYIWLGRFGQIYLAKYIQPQASCQNLQIYPARSDGLWLTNDRNRIRWGSDGHRMRYLYSIDGRSTVDLRSISGPFNIIWVRSGADPMKTKLLNKQ